MKWESPARSSSSYREPTPTKTHAVTDRVCGIELVTTRRPLSSVVFSKAWPTSSA